MKFFIPLFGAAAVGSVVTAVSASFFIVNFFPPAAPVDATDFLDNTDAFLALSEDASEDASTDRGAVPLPPVFFPSVTGTPLVAPPMKYLKAVAGEPKLKKGEMAVRVPVLMYHHIRPLEQRFTAKDRFFSVTPGAFEEQMRRLLAAGYHTITPSDLERALREGPSALPPKPVLLTFDDGYRNQYDNAFPILKKLRLRATFFIISRATPKRGAVSSAMVQEMHQSGLVTIGAHSEHHSALSRVASSTRWEEIAGSKQDLEKMIDAPVTTFAYPYGEYSASILADVQRAGFTSAFWVRLGSTHASSSRYLLRRIRVLDREDIVPILDLFSATSTTLTFHD